MTDKDLFICLELDCQSPNIFSRDNFSVILHEGHKIQTLRQIQEAYNLKPQIEDELAQKLRLEKGIKNHQIPEDFEQKQEKFYKAKLPLFRFTDLGKFINIILLVIIRFTQAKYFTKNFLHADEYYQATEIAYNMVFGGMPVTWEWRSENRIRSYIYPLYLSIPLRILKYFEIDDSEQITVSYYYMQALLVIVSDIYFYKLAVNYMGKSGARLTLYFYFSLRFSNIYILRCFGNSVETALGIIIYYNLSKLNGKFTCNLVMGFVLMVVQFFVRCTSIVSWISVLLYYVFKHFSIINNYVLVTVYFALPLAGLFVYIDSTFYGEFTMAAKNFVEKNIIEDISSKYGVSPTLYYVTDTIPYSLGLATFALIIQALKELLGLFSCRFPSILLYPVSLITMLSFVPHKEERFIQAAFPFMILLIGKFFHESSSTKYRKLGTFVLRIFLFIVLYELILQVAFYIFHQRRYDAVEFVMKQYNISEQIYHGQRFEVPFYSLTHAKTGTKQLDRFFNDRFDNGNYGGTIPWIEGWDASKYQCMDLKNSIKEGWWPPKFVILNDYPEMQECMNILKSLRYELLKVFKTDLGSWEQLLKVQFQPVYVFRKGD